MLGAIAQFETEIRAERQIDGIQKAKAQGVRFGQEKKLTPLQIIALQNRRTQGARIKTLMQEYKISKATVYRYLNQTDSALSAKNAQPAYCTFSRGYAKNPMFSAIHGIWTLGLPLRPRQNSLLSQESPWLIPQNRKISITFAVEMAYSGFLFQCLWKPLFP